MLTGWCEKLWILINHCYQNLGQYSHMNDDKNLSSFLVKARFWRILLIYEMKHFYFGPFIEYSRRSWRDLPCHLTLQCNLLNIVQHDTSSALKCIRCVVWRLPEWGVVEDVGFTRHKSTLARPSPAVPACCCLLWFLSTSVVVLSCNT